MKEILKDYDVKMQKTVDVVVSDFASVRAGRANAAVLDKIAVDYYGSATPINQVAAISSPDPRSLLIKPWDGSLLKAIEKAIQTSDLGINPQNDGSSIRLSFPQLTEERRKELTKQVKKYAENGKVAIRNIRRGAMDKFKAMQKKSEITEDECKEYEKDLQDMTDKRCKQLDRAGGQERDGADGGVRRNRYTHNAVRGASAPRTLSVFVSHHSGGVHGLF